MQPLEAMTLCMKVNCLGYNVIDSRYYVKCIILPVWNVRGLFTHIFHWPLLLLDSSLNIIRRPRNSIVLL